MEKWKVNGSAFNQSIWVEGADGKRVCTVRNCDTDFDRARLIAAAPDLLAICQAIEAHCCANDGVKGDAHTAEGKRLREQLQIAIAKATQENTNG